MSKWTPIAKLWQHVSAHLVALGCVGTAEKTRDVFVEHYGLSPSHWPGWAYVVLGALIYAAGLFTTYYVIRAMARPSDQTPPASTIEAPPPPQDPPAPAKRPEATIPVVDPAGAGPMMTDREKVFAAVMVVAAFSFLAGRGPRK